MIRERKAHWVRPNHQERMPPRMVAFDTESSSTYDQDTETQVWKVGCAVRWRTDLATSDRAEASVFDSPELFWTWVSDYTRKGTRTVVWAHNLGYDVRISRMFDILPDLGFRLEWCNLDRNISSATWRSDHGTIVLADTWTWIPLPLEVIAPQVGRVKYDMPNKNAADTEWARYCMRDAEIVYRVVGELVSFIKSAGLGNWQPTGAGMAYATWRHRFMEDKILVHDDMDAIAAERFAMHTGRAEAWRHGTQVGEKWTEVDLRTAYLVIASECELPRKLHMHHGALSVPQFRRLRERFAVLSRVTVTQDIPILPMRTPERILWPVGTFETWVWDNETDLALRHGAKIRIHEAYTYVRSPVLRSWADWVLSILDPANGDVSSIVRTHIKHCSRALIGRIALRVPSWEYFGDNIEGITGISNMVNADTGLRHRMLHVGNDTLIETRRDEGKDSLPMITGWIMAECRVRLYDTMSTIGFDNIAHVDTDSTICNNSGLVALRDSMGPVFDHYWQIKGTWTRLEVIAPRAYYRDKERVVAGIPRRATETSPGEFEGERWSALASDLADAITGSVRVRQSTWTLKRNDPRRADAAGAIGRTRAYSVDELPSPNRSSDESATDGS